MTEALTIDWHRLFVPSGSLLEIVVRASAMYLLILAGFRVFRRDAGSLSVSDLLVVVLIADAAQNGMAGEYRSVTEGVVIVATIFAWNFVLDWLSFRSRLIYRLLTPPPLTLIVDGHVQRRTLRAQLITMADLREQLREQGIEDIGLVKLACLESDGQISVVRTEDEPPRPAKKR